MRRDGTVHDSLNHYSYGAIAGWLLDGVCGIQFKAGKLMIHPHPHPALGFARAERRTLYGTVKSAWCYKKGKLVFDISVPAPAGVELPNGVTHEVTKGEYHYEVYL